MGGLAKKRKETEPAGSPAQVDTSKSQKLDIRLDGDLDKNITYWDNIALSLNQVRDENTWALIQVALKTKVKEVAIEVIRDAYMAAMESLHHGNNEITAMDTK